MRNFTENSEPAVDFIVKLNAAIQESPAKIDAEYRSTRNSWMACFTTRLQIVLLHLTNAHSAHQLNEERFERAKEKLDALITKVKNLRRTPEYIPKSFIPPESLQQELFKEIDILDSL